MTQQYGLQRPCLDYYAFRHVPYAQFQGLQIIYALFYELQRLPTCSENILIIHHKTQFWISEIHAAYAGTTQHPISRDLQKLLARTPLPRQAWLDMITALEMDTDKLLLENEPEMRRYADKLYGGLFRLIARLLSDRPCPDQALADLAYGRMILALLQDPHREGVRVNLPENASAQVYTLFDEAARTLKQPDHKSLKPLLILTQLYRHQAKQPMVHLSPLKTLGLSICERLSSTS